MAIKLLVVDDHKIMRDGLLALLEGENDIQVVAEAGSGREAIQMAHDHVPDVILMDLTLPDMGGMVATQQIMKSSPQIKVLVLSMHLDDNCLLESLESGVKGYLAKDCASEELITAIRTVYEGKPYFCTDAQEIMLRKFNADSPASPSYPRLTKRELEVLKYTALGYSTKEIAYEFGVSSKMIEVHRMNIRKKTGLNSIAQLTTYALKIGLIQL